MASYLLKADGDFFERVDAAAGKGNRAAFIRSAVEAALEGSIAGKSRNSGSGVKSSGAVKPAVVRSVPKASGRPVSKWASDPRYVQFRDLVVRSGASGVTASQIVRETGWTLLLVERFADAMSGSGEMHYPHGGGRMVSV